jgi:hypothetical protein
MKLRARKTQLVDSGPGGYEQAAVDQALSVLASPDAGPVVPVKGFFISSAKSCYNLM